MVFVKFVSTPPNIILKKLIVLLVLPCINKKFHDPHIVLVEPFRIRTGGPMVVEVINLFNDAYPSVCIIRTDVLVILFFMLFLYCPFISSWCLMHIVWYISNRYLMVIKRRNLLLMRVTSFSRLWYHSTQGWPCVVICRWMHLWNNCDLWEKNI